MVSKIGIISIRTTMKHPLGLYATFSCFILLIDAQATGEGSLPTRTDLLNSTFHGFRQYDVNLLKTTEIVTLVSSTNESEHDNFSQVTKVGKHNFKGCDLMDEECCEAVYESFLRTWFEGKLKLTVLLSKLKLWKCSQFSLECKRRTFAFNQYTKLVYQRFCDLEAYHINCKDEIDQDRSIKGFFQKECNQVNMFDTSEEYLEIIAPYTPFCGIVWCGFSLDAVVAKNLSVWSCMKPRCQAYLVVLMMICGILALLTIVLNTTVIAVLTSLPNSNHSQVLYKISLAVADLLVGLTVFASFITTLYFRLIAQREVIYEDEDRSNYTANFSTSKIASFDDDLNKHYLSAVGVFTNVSVLVSICTLLLASFDRLRAVWKPMSYSKAEASLTAKWTVCLVWVAAFILATLPLYVPKLSPYSLISGLIVATKADGAIIVYFAAFILPLITVWAIIITTFCIVKRQAKRRKVLTNNKLRARQKRHYKVIKTLFIMLSAFTMSLIPVIIALFIQIDPRVHDLYPENLDPNVSSAVSSYQLVAIIFLTCNSLWNFFIYSARDPKFKKHAIHKHTAIWSVNSFHKRSSVKFPPTCKKQQPRKRFSSIFFHLSESPKSPSPTETAIVHKRRRKLSSVFEDVTDCRKTCKTNVNKSTNTKRSRLLSVLSFTTLSLIERSKEVSPTHHASFKQKSVFQPVFPFKDNDIPTPHKFITTLENCTTESTKL